MIMCAEYTAGDNARSFVSTQIIKIIDNYYNNINYFNYSQLNGSYLHEVLVFKRKILPINSVESQIQDIYRDDFTF